MGIYGVNKSAFARLTQLTTLVLASLMLTIPSATILAVGTVSADPITAPWSFTDVGHFSTGPSDPAEEFGMNAGSSVAINNDGGIAGSACCSSATGTAEGSEFSHAVYMSSDGTVINLPEPSGTLQSEGLGINNAGEVVGDVAFGGKSQDAYAWNASGESINLGTLGGIFSYANGVNDSGEIVGSSQTASYSTHAFVWTSSGGMVDIGTLGGRQSYAFAVNNEGEVVGNSLTASGVFDAFLWSPASGMVDLGGGSADAINDNGDITGTNSSGEAVYWTPDHQVHDLGIQGGGTGINNSNQIVGYFEAEPGKPFIWTQQTGAEFLAAYAVPGEPSGEFATANDINDNGRIVGTSGVGNPNSSDFHVDVLTWDTVAIPPAPANLSAPTPTDQPPVLSWSSVSGATYFNVYRNGSLIDTVSADNTTYTDVAALYGSTDTYYVTAVNAAGESSPSSSVAVTVTDPAPAVGAIAAPGTLAKGDSLTATAPFTYLDTTDAHTAFWDWGDGTTATGVVTEDGGSGSVSGSHVYTAAGSYTITVSVTNAYGKTGTHQFVIAVIPTNSGSFRGANLSGLNYAGADLSNLDIRGSNLRGGTFTNVDFQGSNLSGSNVSNADFQNANFTSANLAGANFQGADLTSANFTGANLRSANFRNATTTNVTWSNTTCPDGTNSDNNGLTCAGHGTGL